MSFQITPLPASAFTPLFALEDDALAARNARRSVVTEAPGVPCRVSLEEARIGETVLLVNYEHQPGNSPYRSRHAVYVRECALEAKLAIGEVPEMIRRRLISLRGFDAAHMMVVAEVMEGAEVAAGIEAAFEDPEVAYIHLHIARPGCFAAAVQRVA